MNEAFTLTGGTRVGSTYATYPFAKIVCGQGNLEY